MRRRHRMVILAGVLLALVGCQDMRARRFPPVAANKAWPEIKFSKDAKPDPIPAHYGWLEPKQRLDIPIEFVTEQSADWQKLKDLWTDFPGKAGLGLWPLGLPPLEAVVALEAQVQSEKIKIKVPRGLPDPTPYLPATNPPTYGKWLLGRKLFFDRTLLAVAPGQATYCADCHNPAQNFCSTKKTTLSGRRNVPSLVNSIYNRRQFWDGRAGTLEEVLLRQLEDERPLTQEPSPEQSPGNLHVWPGLIGHLRGRHDYLYAFQRAFGTDPTADNVAKAVSTYLRTLLSGDSIYDQAEQNRQRRKGETLEAKDIEPALSSAAIEALPVKLTAKEAAQQMARGHELFHGRAGCSSCHPAPLFTDDGFHNVGVGDSDSPQLFSPGKEPGRFAHVPYGLKDKYLIGAYRTPTLRNVVLTAPYMHDGSLATVKEVLRYFNDGISIATNPFLDPQLVGAREAEGTVKGQRLGLSAADLDALELFLWSLRGHALPPNLVEPPGN